MISRLLTPARSFALSLLVLVGSETAAPAQFFFPGFGWQPQPEAAPQAAPARRPAAPRPRARPAPAAPESPPAEATVLNRELKLHGAGGGFVMERVGPADLRARLTLDGTRLSRPGEACTVRYDSPVPITPRGQVQGLAQYEVAAPGCPMTADLLDGGLWVRAPQEGCVFATTDCRVDPRGLWGPAPAALVPLARQIEQDRGRADRTVREHYKALTQRAPAQDVRAIVSEQAAFSSEREMLCRGYAREPAHGFCNARFTQARAAQLAARLGLASPAAQPAAAPRRPVQLVTPPATSH